MLRVRISRRVSRGISRGAGLAVLAASLSLPIAPRVEAAPPNPAERRCLVELTRAGTRVAEARADELLRCTRAADRGGLPAGQDFEACVSADPSGRVARAANMTEVAEARWCDDPPAFGARSAADANRMISPLRQARALLGEDLDSVMGAAAPRPVAACRLAATRAVARVAKARLRAFLDCVETGLASGTIGSQETLEACVSADPRGDVARMAERASADVAARCGGADVAVALPGRCAESSAAALGSCLEPQATCEACLALNEGERLAVGCHRFEDGVATAYCGDRPDGGLSVAREWDEALLAAIRIDTPRPVVHSRNLFHLSVAMWDAWVAYDVSRVADAFLHHEEATAEDPGAARDAAISFAAYRLIKHRFAASPGAVATNLALDERFYRLGYDKNFTSTGGDAPAALGNRIAAAVIAWGLADGSNEAGGYADPTYASVNPPLVVVDPGTTLTDPSRWQPLSLSVQIGQNGVPIPGNVQVNIGPHWFGVTPFALRRSAPGAPYFAPPGPPLVPSALAEYQDQALEVIEKQSLIDPEDPTVIDASPGSMGANTLGTNDGTGHAVNPVTGAPYAPNPVRRQDFYRVLGMYWADGPSSETPPGHWNSIANDVTDSPGFQRRIGGVGPVLDPLEWDVKLYLALNGAVHDAGIAAWEQKRLHDSPRPISMIRWLGGNGQSSDPSDPSFDPAGLPLVPGLVEVITPESSAPGERHAHLAAEVGKIAVRGWKGEPADPRTQVGGVGWILATRWLAYQRKTFVTPAFPGFVSGHSTFSRAAAEVMTEFTGSAYFPGGIGEFVAPADEFLPPEKGPTEPVRLQNATYDDAADQAGISRLWSGIHVRADDFAGRRIGSECGLGALALARRHFDGTAVP